MGFPAFVLHLTYINMISGVSRDNFKLKCTLKSL